MVSWLPILIQNTGVSMRTAALMTSYYYAAGVLCAVGAGYIMDKINPFKILTITVALQALGIAIFGVSTQIVWLFMICLALDGSIGGSMIDLNALCSQVYPTSIRASGVSWALGVGRAGAVVGGMAGGFMLAAHWGMPVVFITASIPGFIAAASIFLLRGTKLEGAVPADLALKTAAADAN
jgi:AAHS family 4-hydroxybenzoate transporter-like MFS transporter